MEEITNVVYYYSDRGCLAEWRADNLVHDARGNVSAGGKLTTRWDELKSFGK